MRPLNPLPAPADVEGDLAQAFREVEQRHRVYHALAHRLAKRDRDPTCVDDYDGKDYLAAIELSATDLFVEKAHIDLLRRAKWSKAWAAITGAGATLLVGFIAYQVHLSAPKFGEPSRDLYYFIFDVVRALAFDGILLGLVFFLASLCRAFLHEATLMENRLHAARMGRLYIYLKFAGLKKNEDIKDARDELVPEKLVNIFGWNIETSTAFKDINPKGVAMGLIGQASELLAKAVEAAKVTEERTHASRRKADDGD